MSPPAQLGVAASSIPQSCTTLRARDLRRRSGEVNQFAFAAGGPPSTLSMRSPCCGRSGRCRRPGIVAVEGSSPPASTIVRVASSLPDRRSRPEAYIRIRGNRPPGSCRSLWSRRRRRNTERWPQSSNCSGSRPPVTSSFDQVGTGSVWCPGTHPRATWRKSGRASSERTCSLLCSSWTAAAKQIVEVEGVCLRPGRGGKACRPRPPCRPTHPFGFASHHIGAASPGSWHC